MSKRPPVQAEVVADDDRPPPESGSDRVKATKLRAKVKVGAPLSPEEALWLEDYERARDDRMARGASRSRTVEYRESESAAVGTGSAADIAAAAALAREEGRRYDHLLDGAVRALTAACTLHQQMAATLLSRAQEDGQTMRELMVSVRTHYLERTELEAQRIRDEAEREAEETKGGDGITKLAEQLLPILLEGMVKSGKLPGVKT